MLFYALRSNLAVVIEEVHNIINGCECKCGAGICAAVVDADSSGVSVNEVSAGECNCVGITNELIVLLRAEEVGSTSLENLPRLVLIEESCGEAIYIAVAGSKYTVVENEPAAIGLYRNRTCAHLSGFPALGGTHYVSVLAPECEVGRLADEHIAERSVSAVGRTAHHHVLAVDLSGEHNAVSVEGEVCVLKLCEGLEIVGVSDTDGRLPAVSVHHVTTYLSSSLQTLGS